MADLTLDERLDDAANEGESVVEEIVDYLIFVCGDLKLGVEARNVVEILNGVSITYMPMVPEHIQGIINLRGQMLPILNVRTMLDLEPANSPLVIVLNLDEMQIGLLVDEVDQMVGITKSVILPMPAQETQKLVCGICTIPDRSGTMLVLDCEQLMPNEC